MESFDGGPAPVPRHAERSAEGYLITRTCSIDPKIYPDNPKSAKYKAPRVSARPQIIHFLPKRRPAVIGPPFPTVIFQRLGEKVVPLPKSEVVNKEKKAAKSRMDLEAKKKKLADIFNAPVLPRKTGVKFTTPKAEKVRKIKTSEKAAEYVVPLRKETNPIRPGIVRKVAIITTATTTTAEAATTTTSTATTATITASTSLENEIDLLEIYINDGDKLL